MGVTHVEFLEIVRHQNIKYLHNVIMIEAIQDSNFPQDALAIDQVFKDSVDLLDSHNALFLVVVYLTDMSCKQNTWYLPA